MIRSPIAAVVLSALTAVAVAACGSSGKPSASGAATGGAGRYAAQPHARSGAGPSEARARGGAGASSPTGTTVTVVDAGGQLGSILAAGPGRRTAYLFEADHGSTSACAGACAQVWPPVTTGAAPSAAGGAMADRLGTITRTDGTRQVTYAGHPLYFYVGDSRSTDANGEGSKGFGAGWYVLAPDGKKIDRD